MRSDGDSDMGKTLFPTARRRPFDRANPGERPSDLQVWVAFFGMCVLSSD